MYYNKHFPGPNTHKENNQVKVRPGQFSNHGNINAYHEKESNSRSKSPSPFHYDQRKIYKDPNPNISFEGISRIQTHVTTDNEQYHPLFEQGPMEPQPEQYFANYESVSSNQQSEKGALAPRNANIQSKNPSRNQSIEKVGRKSVNENSQPKIRKNLSNSNLQKSAGAPGQKQASRINAWSNQKSSAPHNQMSYGKLPRYQPENDENHDINAYQYQYPPHQQSQQSLHQSQQSLTASRSSSYLKSNEKKRQPQPQPQAQQQTLFLDNSISQDLSIINDDFEKIRRENMDMKTIIAQLTEELQIERNKNETVENELNTLTNNITEERAKYQGELMKISMQIKKLRNIQNIYVNEKKNSERLEGELNEKNKLLEQVSCFSADCVRSILLTLEYLLVKGDLHFEKQEFNPSDYLRLIYEIRKNLLPSVELADSFALPSEWKISDYQQIIYNTRELMKFRKSNNFFSESKNILSQYGSNDRKNFNAALSTQYSSKQTTSRSHAILPINTCSSLTPQGQNFTTFSNTPSDTSKRAIFENQNQTNLTYSTKTTEPKVKSNQEYIPFNSRVNIIEHLSNRDDFEEYMNQKENENEHYFVEPLESPRKDQKHQSIEKNSEEREGNSENMGGSLGSTILPRTNNCSGFNETFENLIVDNKLQEERRLSEITISNSYQSKNYDLPLSSFNNGYGQSQPSHSNSLKQQEYETTKNKNFKKRADHAENNRRDMEIIKPPSNSVTYLKEQSVSNDGVQVTMGELESESPSHQEFFTATDGPKKPAEEKFNVSQGYVFSPKEEMNQFRDYDLPKQDTRSSNLSSAYQESPQNRETPFIHESHSKKISSVTNSSQKQQQQLSNQFSLQGSPIHQSSVIIRKDNSPVVMRKDTTSSETRSSFSDSSAGQYVTAKYDFKAQKENDLDFLKGDRIQILKKTENGWWIGMCNNRIGYFPYNFVTMAD